MVKNRISFSSFVKPFWRNDFFIAFAVLVLFLSTNRYIYGWDDQHLEIPLLKHLIDPQLYAGDYYVEALAKHFSSYLFPILARVITVDMIPMTYLVLYCLVRFVFFYWVFRLWHLISRDRLTAFAATLSLFLLGRTEEFIYRTFSHEEFSFAIIFAGIYFFYRQRLLLAAVLLGLAANFHALYALFPMIFLSVYALLFVKDKGMTFLKTGLAFSLAALPFILWHIPQAMKASAIPVPLSEWVPLYLLSCPQCFPLGNANPENIVASFQDVWNGLYPYLFLLGLYLGHCVFNRDFRKDKKIHVIFWVSAVFIAMIFFFAYVKPSRFILDLNLSRFAQFVHFFLMGYTVVFLMKMARKDNPLWALVAGVLFLLIGFSDTTSTLAPLWHRVADHKWTFLSLLGLLGVLVWKRTSPVAGSLRKAFLVVPLLGMFIGYCIVHYDYVQLTQKGGGFWQLQRNWEDMQRYVRDHTPKNAMIFTPYDMEMGGFRIHSNRKVVVCYRDCGIIGFDFEAAREWQRRINDVQAFKVFTKEDILPALMIAVGKYKADYVVFMNYYAPKNDVGPLRREYANEVFALYRIQR